MSGSKDTSGGVFVEASAGIEETLRDGPPDRVDAGWLVSHLFFNASRRFDENPAVCVF